MILCDTGPLVAAANRSDGQFHVCTELFTGLHLAGRRILVPGTVAAEVGYLLGARAGVLRRCAKVGHLVHRHHRYPELGPTPIAQFQDAVTVAGLVLTAVAAALVGWAILRTRNAADRHQGTGARVLGCSGANGPWWVCARAMTFD